VTLHRDAEAALDVGVLDVLVRLIGGSDAGARSTVIDLYLADAERRVVDLLAAVAAGDGEAVARAAHGLRSSSALLGAGPLAHALRTCERAARLGRGDLDGLGARVDGEYRELARRLLDLRGDAPA
jgi:HPt (histidine-containing phosphotransfer) domain-containing protein